MNPPLGRVWLYIAIPSVVGGAAFAVLVFRLITYQRFKFIEKDQSEDRVWLGISILAVPPVALFLYVLLLFKNAQGPRGESDFLILLLPAAIGSLLVTFFAIGIPLRLAMNLAVRSRRSRYWLESIALVVTFTALAWMLYIL